MKTRSLSSLVVLIGLTVCQMGMAQDSAEVKAEKAKLAKIEAAYKSAKVAYNKRPKDTKLKKTFVDSAVALGTATMTSAALTPREKYPKALSLYREALKLDPKNKEATTNKQMIESIYKQMGRPIPKG